MECVSDVAGQRVLVCALKTFGTFAGIGDLVDIGIGALTSIGIATLLDIGVDIGIGALTGIGIGAVMRS